MRWRQFLAGAGVLAVVVAAAVAVEPSVLGLGASASPAEVVGVVALLLAAWGVRRRLREPLREAAVPAVESHLESEVPGDDFDDVLVNVRRDGGTRQERDRIADRLHATASAVLTTYDNLTTSAAESALEAGTWSEDADANAFFASRSVSPPRLARFRGTLDVETDYQRRIRHVVGAVAERAHVAVPDDVPCWPTPSTEERVELDGARGHHRVRETGRWRGAGAAALVAIGVGVLTGRPPVLLAAVAGFGFAGYAHLAEPRDVDVRVERELTDTDPDPGDVVWVTVTVTNEGGFLPDLRIVDGVPGPLPVVAGSPRMGAPLRAGRSASFRYAVAARRGAFDFEWTRALARDASGALEQEITVENASSLTCRPHLRPTEEVPLRRRAAGTVGEVPTGGGSGVEFYATRNYRRGDPMNRIDWKRLARSGDLATVEFHEEHIARVMVVVDARPATYCSPDDGYAHATDRAVSAAGRVLATVLDRGNLVGVTATHNDPPWLGPGAGDAHRARARDLLATHPALAAEPTGGQFASLPWLRRLRRRLPEATQVVFVSALVDDYATLLVRWLEGEGYPVTVVSPDPTAADTVGHRLARVERSLRQAALRGRDVPVVDWQWEEPLDAALLRAKRVRQ